MTDVKVLRLLTNLQLPFDKPQHERNRTWIELKNSAHAEPVEAGQPFFKSN